MLLEGQEGQVQVGEAPVLLGRQRPLQVGEPRPGVLGERVGDDLLDVGGALAGDGADAPGQLLPRIWSAGSVLAGSASPFGTPFTAFIGSSTPS